MIGTGDLIQIVIPCFNGEDYLEETLLRVKNQINQNFDCLIIDDASTDNSFEIANQFVTQDRRFRIFKNIQNLAESASANRGWKIAVLI